MLFFKRDNN